MKLYKAMTTYPAADGPSAYYFSTKERARKFLKDCSNGEVVAVIERKVKTFPYEGATWGEIEYVNEL